MCSHIDAYLPKKINEKTIKTLNDAKSTISASKELENLLPESEKKAIEWIQLFM